MKYYIHGGQAFCASNIRQIEDQFSLSERHDNCEREVFFASNNDLDTQDILYFLSTTPIFCETRLGIIKDAKSNPKLMRAILNTPNIDNVHIIVVDVVDTQPKKKITKNKTKTNTQKNSKTNKTVAFPQTRTIEKAGFTILNEQIFNRLTGPQHIANFIRQNFNMNMDMNDARSIFDSYDQNMSLIINDLNNILLYMGQIEDRSNNNIANKLKQAKPKTAKDILKYLPFYKTTNIFPLLDAFSEKNKYTATRILHNILQSNINDATLIALFNSIFRQVKHIYGLHIDTTMVTNKNTLPTFAIRSLQQKAVNKWTITQMTLFFHEAAKLDFKQKTGAITPQDALITIVEMLPYNTTDGLTTYEL